MSPAAEKVLALARARLVEWETKILEGKTEGDGTVEGRFIAYRAAVSFRRECYRLITDVENIFGNKDEEAEG